MSDVIGQFADLVNLVSVKPSFPNSGIQVEQVIDMLLVDENDYIEVFDNGFKTKKDCIFGIYMKGVVSWVTANTGVSGSAAAVMRAGPSASSTNSLPLTYMTASAGNADKVKTTSNCSAFTLLSLNQGTYFDFTAITGNKNVKFFAKKGPNNVIVPAVIIQFAFLKVIV